MTDIGLKLPRRGESPRWTLEPSAGHWASTAESAGYDTLWAAEGWGSNAFMALAEAAAATETIRLGTAIANVYSRSPAVLAMSGATLARQSGGRAVLGLGASHAGLVEGLHGTPYERPVRRCHEVMAAVRELTGADGPVEYEGEVLSAEWPTPLDTAVPVYNAAMGPANRRATGRLADGWIPYMLPLSNLESAFEAVADAARAAGRDPSNVSVVPQLLAAVDEDGEAAREPIREYVGTYIGSYGNYREITARDYPEATEAIAAAWEAGDEAAAIDRVPDEMVEEFGIAGPPEEARSQLMAATEMDVVDEVLVYPPAGVSRDMLERTVTALSPDRL